MARQTFNGNTWKANINFDFMGFFRYMNFEFWCRSCVEGENLMKFQRNFLEDGKKKVVQRLLVH